MCGLNAHRTGVADGHGLCDILGISRGQTSFLGELPFILKWAVQYLEYLEWVLLVAGEPLLDREGVNTGFSQPETPPGTSRGKRERGGEREGGEIERGERQREVERDREIEIARDR